MTATVIIERQTFTPEREHSPGWGQTLLYSLNLELSYTIRQCNQRDRQRYVSHDNSSGHCCKMTQKNQGNVIDFFASMCITIANHRASASV